MLSIDKIVVEETLTFEELFNQLQFDINSSVDSEGDSFLANEWNIDVLSDGGFNHIEGFRWTKPESVFHLFLENNIHIKCADHHVVATDQGWVRVCDLSNSHRVKTTNGLSNVLNVKRLSSIERLCDLQVADSHSFFANCILSHNSHFLVMLGVEAMKEKKNVLHYTLELTEEAVGLRYDSNLNSINADDVIDSKQKIIDFYAGNENRLGQLRIKFFPPNTATVYTLRAHIERLALKGFVPDLLIIDYADIMRSSRQYDSLRHELKLVYEELRGLAMERMIPCWTGSQSNKDGANSDIVELTNMSEAYGKAMTADFVLGISRKPSEKSQGTGRLHVAKNRAGRDGMVYAVVIDTAQSKFKIVSSEQSYDEAIRSDETDLKAKLREKWKELKNEELIKAPEPERV